MFLAAALLLPTCGDDELEVDGDSGTGDTDTTSADECPFQCIPPTPCVAEGGKVWGDWDCPNPEDACCELGVNDVDADSDTDSDSDTDTSSDTDTITDTGTDTDIDSDTDTDCDYTPYPDTDTLTDTGTDTDVDSDTDTDCDYTPYPDTDTEVYAYQYESVCCDGTPTSCADIGEFVWQQERGCCLDGDLLYRCVDDELVAEPCCGWCAYDGETEQMACLDIPHPAPCWDRTGSSYWDSEFFEFPAGTVCCESLPTTCADIGDTPEEQFAGCCEADMVHWCAAGELYSDYCGSEGTCAWADNGLMWCDAGFVEDASPCPAF